MDSQWEVLENVRDQLTYHCFKLALKGFLRRTKVLISRDCMENRLHFNFSFFFLFFLLFFLEVTFMILLISTVLSCVINYILIFII